MSNNPDVQVAFSGDVPNLELEIDRSPREVEMATSPQTLSLELSTDRGGSLSNIIAKTTAEWALLVEYVPAYAEIDIYTDHGEVDEQPVPGIKVGDGESFVADLPFVGDDVRDGILALLGDLAYKDSASGSFTPEGTVSAPTISVATPGATQSISPFGSAGSLPGLEMSASNGVLTISFSQGTLPSAGTAVAVKTGDAAYSASQPTFTGTAGTVEVS